VEQLRALLRQSPDVLKSARVAVLREACCSSRVVSVIGNGNDVTPEIGDCSSVADFCARFCWRRQRTFT